MLHVIGNSHARFFCGEELTGGKSWRVFEPYQAIPDFKVWTINGGPTAWNFTNKYLTQVYDMGIPVESKLLLCFGEIDVRHTIPKRFDKLTDAMVNLMVCVNRYFFGIDELSKLYKVALWGVHPVTRKKHCDNEAAKNAMFRTALAQMWNELCAERCKVRGLHYFNIFDKLQAEDGLVNGEYMMDDIHLSQGAMPLALAELNGWEKD